MPYRFSCHSTKSPTHYPKDLKAAQTQTIGNRQNMNQRTVQEQLGEESTSGTRTFQPPGRANKDTLKQKEGGGRAAAEM